MTPRVALAGNPNTGKTSVFNRLTGANARVGNYPGVTVERESGHWSLPGLEVELIDVPGTYSLAARSPEEQVAVRALFGLDGENRPHVVVLVLDATQLLRNLYLAMQVVEAGIPAVFALNLMDVARKQGVVIDMPALTERFGVPLVQISAHTGEGFAELAKVVERVILHPDEGRGIVGWRYPRSVEQAVTRLLPLSAAHSPAEGRALALWTLLSVGEGDELLDVPATVRREVGEIRKLHPAAEMDAEIVGARYAFLDGRPLVRTPSQQHSFTERVDAWALHPVAGLVLFVAVMGMLFQALFSWSEPAINLIESLFGWTGDLVSASLPAGLFSELIVDGLIGGVGSVVVFLPQILLLFFLLGLLEDSGYMARVAYLVDRAMRALGLHGRAFVPMLSGYACAVPAVMATRTLESRRDRLLTMMVVPLMSCSARLPVYTLVIASLFPTGNLLGFFPIQSALMVGMYLFSTGTALLAAGVLGRTVLKGKRIPLLMELPPYRLPRLRTVLWQMWMRARSFLTEAGTVILACTVVLWALLSFPRDIQLSRDYEGERVTMVAGGATEELLAAVDAEERGERLQQSYAGRMGKAIEPVIAPLGFDWKIGIGLVGAFAAREVFVSTMGLVYGIGGEVSEESEPLREKMAAERHRDGSVVYTPLTGLSLMVFFALSAQCMSTLAAVRREANSWGWAGFLFVYMTLLAWVASFLVYQGGRLLGFA